MAGKKTKKNNKKIKKTKEELELIMIIGVEATMVKEDDSSISCPEMGWNELREAIKNGKIKYEIKKVNYK